MKIECTLRREGGTHVKIDDVIYHFAPSSSDPRHIADVTDKKHAQRFLVVAEAYTFADDLPDTSTAGKSPRVAKPELRQASEGAAAAQESQ